MPQPKIKFYFINGTFSPSYKKAGGFVDRLTAYPDERRWLHFMESALIVACTEKSIAYFTALLQPASYTQITAAQSCGEARRLLLTRYFDLVLVNAPLRDESGEHFARDIAAAGSTQVMLIVASEFFDAAAAACENDGVLTIAKPINRTVFWAALHFARAAQSRLTRIQAENSKLKQKLADIRVIDRAKCLLIAYLNLNEQEAHRYIEKQAMDTRTSKRIVAEGILKTYEN